MNINLNFGKDESGKNTYIDLQKENLHTIFLTGSTGTGKSILHFYLYKQLMDNNSPKEIGFVFMDMTRVDFTGWKTSFLHMPVINDSEKAFDALEELTDYNGNKKIFIQIEECDMIVHNTDRFEKSWVKIHKNKNIYIIFSTSRPVPDIFTDKIKKNCDMVIACRLASKDDSQTVIGKSLAEKFTQPGEKIIVYKDKEILCVPIESRTVEDIRKFDEGMTVNNY